MANWSYNPDSLKQASLMAESISLLNNKGNRLVQLLESPDSKDSFGKAIDTAKAFIESFNKAMVGAVALTQENCECVKKQDKAYKAIQY